MTTEPRKAGLALNPSRTVGSRAAVDDTSTATRVGFDGPHLVYQQEVCIQVVNLRRAVTLSGGRACPWRRLEIKALRGEATPRDWVVIAEHPWSQHWHHLARFRPISRVPIDERGELSGAGSIEDALAALEAIEALDTDPWENDSKILTAAMSQPQLPLELHKPRNVLRRLREVFGICEDPHGLTRHLLTCSPVRKLLEWTEDGTLKFAFTDDQPTLYPEVVAEAHTLAFLAVRLALAGPPGTESLTSEAWEGREVADLVGFAYRDLINAANRRAAAKRAIEEEGFQIEELSDDSSWSAPNTLLELVSLAKEYSAHSDPKVRRRAKRALAALLADPSE